MVAIAWRRLFQSLTSGHAQRRVDRRAPGKFYRTRLCLEALEDRLVPSNSIPLSATTWQALGPGPISGGGAAIGLQPNELDAGRITDIADAGGGNVYVATAGGGVWSGSIGGGHWTPLMDNYTVPSGFPSLNITSIASPPGSPNVIYAGTGTTNGFEKTYGIGLLVSTDSGQTWTLQNNGGAFYRENINKILVDPSDPNHLYVSVSPDTAAASGLTNELTAAAGLYGSIDGGQSWTLINSYVIPGDPPTMGNITDPITDMYQFPLHDGRILVAEAGITGPARIFQTTTTYYFLGSFSGTVTDHEPQPTGDVTATLAGNIHIKVTVDTGSDISDQTAGTIQVTLTDVTQNPSAAANGMDDDYTSGTWDSGVVAETSFDTSKPIQIDVPGGITVPFQLLINSMDTTGGTATMQFPAAFSDGSPEDYTANVSFSPDPGKQPDLGVHDDGTLNLEELTSFTALGINSNNLKIAVGGPVTKPVYYVSADALNGSTQNVWRSDDGGKSWQALNPNPPFNYMGAQGNYDTTLIVDPNDPNTIYAGGSTTFIRGVGVSTDGGKTYHFNFQNITNDPNGGIAPHADHHAIAFVQGYLIDGNDGGLWRLDNASSPMGYTWNDINGDIQDTLFSSIALDPYSDNYAYAGAQDNGASGFADFGLGASTAVQWNQFLRADGGQVRVDPGNGTTVYAEFQYRGSNRFLQRSDQGGALGTFVPITTGLGLVDSPAGFQVPFVIDPSSPNHLLLGTNILYETLDHGDHWHAITGAIFGGSAINAIAVAPNDPNTVYVTAGGSVWVTRDALSGAGALWTQINTGLTAADRFNDIEVNPANSTVAYMVRAYFNSGANINHVFASHIDPNTHQYVWQSIDGNLPDLPTRSIAIDPVHNILFVGNDNGVWSSSNGGANWAPYGSGLPPVTVTQLEFNTKLNVLAASTFGRGIWEITGPLAPVQSKTIVSGAPNPASVNATVTFTATVTDNNNKPITVGTVTFSQGGSTLGTATLDGNGQAVVATTFSTLGTKTVTANYNGGQDTENQYQASSNTVDENIDQLTLVPTNTVVQATPNPARPIDSVTFTATVTDQNNNAIGAGTVDFKLGNLLLGSGTVDSTGHATYTFKAPFLPSGIYTITADYTGFTTVNNIEFLESNNSVVVSSSFDIVRAPSGPIATTTPTFSWPPVTGATSYYLYVIDLSAGGGLVLNLPNLTNNVLTLSTNQALRIGHFYRWWIGAVLSSGIDWGNSLDFNIPVTALAPSGPLTTSMPTFSWAGITGASSFELYVYDQTTGRVALDLPNLSGTSKTLSTVQALTIGDTFTWWIGAVEGQNSPAWSSGLNFSIPITTIGPSGLILTNQPTYAWNDVTGAGSYDLYIYDQTAGKVVINSGGISSSASTTQAQSLTIGHTYTWWIGAVQGPHVAWSAGLTFTVLVTAIGPSGPLATALPTFSWNTVTGAGSYELYIYDQTAGKVAQDLPVSNTPYTLTQAQALTIGHSYTWWIGAIVGQSTTWSSGLNISIPMTTIGPNGTIATNQPTLTWKAIPGAGSYDLYIYDQNTGAVSVNLKNLSGSSYTLSAAQALPVGDAFTWWVGAVQGTNVAWSNARTFTPAGNVLSPSGNITTANPDFSWLGVIGATSYELWVSDNSTGQLITDSPGITATHTTLGQTLTVGDNYTWYIGAVQGQNAPAWSRGLNFTVVLTPAGPKGNIATNLPTFSWTNVAGIGNYSVYVVDLTSNQAFTLPNLSSTPVTLTAANALTIGHNYRWWVGAVQGGATHWSRSTDFSIAPTGISPNGPVLDSMPRFSWNTVTGADHYYLYVIDLTTGALLVNSPNIKGTSATPTVGFGPDDTYEWWVAAVGANPNNFSWSVGLIFTIAGLDDG